MAADRRWIILAQDGRHVTVGRAAPPSEAEIEAASAALAAQGLAGWLATLDGNYWSRRRITIAPVQIVGDDAPLDWSAAMPELTASTREAARRLASVTPPSTRPSGRAGLSGPPRSIE